MSTEERDTAHRWARENRCGVLGHLWRKDYSQPVIDTNPPIYSYRCARCSVYGSNDWAGVIHASEAR